TTRLSAESETSQARARTGRFSPASAPEVPVRPGRWRRAEQRPTRRAKVNRDDLPQTMVEETGARHGWNPDRCRTRPPCLEPWNRSPGTELISDKEDTAVSIVVQKFGGSSVADAESVKRVAKRIVEYRQAGHEVVVVVSAMGDSTDDLIDLAQQVSAMPPARELDMLLTAGERISMAVLAMAISNLGFEADSFTGSKAGVITDEKVGKARIIDVTPGRIRSSLDEGYVAIVAGFQGVSQTAKNITTLGRGGSDTTAVALAASLDADVCEIYTDVDGVFTA